MLLIAQPRKNVFTSNFVLHIFSPMPLFFHSSLPLQGALPYQGHLVSWPGTSITLLCRRLSVNADDVIGCRVTSACVHFLSPCVIGPNCLGYIFPFAQELGDQRQYFFRLEVAQVHIFQSYEVKHIMRIIYRALKNPVMIFECAPDGQNYFEANGLPLSQPAPV